MDAAFYTDPFTGHVESMPFAMIDAYVPEASSLHLEEAARVAAIRDMDAADNLLLSIYPDLEISPEGHKADFLAVPLPV